MQPSQSIDICQLRKEGDCSSLVLQYVEESLCVVHLFRMLKKKPKGDEGPTRPREGDKGSDQVKDSQREKKNAVTTTTTTVQNQYKRGRKVREPTIPPIWLGLRLKSSGEWDSD